MLKQGDLVTYTPYTTDVELSGATVGRVISIDDNDFADIALASLDGSSIVRQKVPLAATGFNVYKATPVELERFDLEITDFATRIQNITPTPSAGQYYFVHRTSLEVYGGATPWSALTNSHGFKFVVNVNGTAASAVELNAASSTFNYAIAESNLEVLSPVCVDGVDVTDKTSHLAKPIAILLGPNGIPTATTKTNGGSGYVANEVITMTNGATVTVLTVSAGVVATYSVSGTAIALGAATQDSTDGAGTGFAMTVDTVNRYSGGTGTAKVSVWATLETV